MSKKILIVGSGAREHALGWKLSQNKDITDIFYSPGNAGTQKDKGQNILIDGTKKENFSILFDFIKNNHIDLTIIGPEQPLANGLVDFLHSRGYDRVFGPTQEMAKIESDKFYSSDLMEEINIPQADFVKCYNIEEARDAINKKTTEKGIVIKARGLTSGKGVSVHDSKEDALEEINSHNQKYGPEVLISERLFGQEFSIFGIADGKNLLSFEMAFQDHKPAYDKDVGPNTGGMGAYGPAPIASVQLVKKIVEEIMTPLVRKINYTGFLYAGMIMTEQGPKVIEFNARFGDPECQPAMMMLKSDLYEPLSLAVEGKLNETKIEFNPGASCCVVLASKGYPRDYNVGLPISGIREAEQVPGVEVFHAGTKLKDDKILTNGGRVLGVTAYSPNEIKDAQKSAYDAVSKINVPGGFHFRTDIGSKAINL